MQDKHLLLNYRNHVLSKYQIYNSLFLNLPFDAVYQTGVLLPILSHACEQGYQQQKNPDEIIKSFFAQQDRSTNSRDQIATLFKFIQYIERQIVLFDAIEEAAYLNNHDLDGVGSMTYLAQQAKHMKLEHELRSALADYRVRVVLTAHPTQFYPGPVLGIMTDLSQAIESNDLPMIEQLLQQLGKTPLFSKAKPTPFDEAVSLIWYLENVFYGTIKNILKRIKSHIYPEQSLPDNSFIELGFWPGGDRDGNPFVDASITLKVADRLRRSILKCYYRDVRLLKRRLTFDGVDKMVEKLEQNLYQAAYLTQNDTALSVGEILDQLQHIHREVASNHHGLYLEMIEDLINQVKTFGLHFATLDVRQDSRIHHQVMCEVALVSDDLDTNYGSLNMAEQVRALRQIKTPVVAAQLDTAVAQDTLNSILAIEKIQQLNGELGANRYIISNCQKAINVLEVLALFRLSGWCNEQVAIDVVPLFETIDDLQRAPGVMDTLLADPDYRAHLQGRNNQQTIMLGFSDGTKDGGYLAANWAIVEAKTALSRLFKQHSIEVTFFDGRGGPPARGGGETHKFYAAQNPEIANHATELTIQGQTISANFGHDLSARYNLEQLLSAGVSSQLMPAHAGWDQDSQTLLKQLAKTSLAHYQKFKQHPQFIPYLEKISTLKYYGKTNIGSRPTKRSKGEGLVFEDLRAIPFVGAWSQLKQNVLGYYGVGYACQQLIDNQQLPALQRLYQQSGYFKALVDNSMMSIAKSFMPLTAYLREDAEFGPFWETINQEFEQSKKHLMAIAQVQTLLQDQPLRQQSIQARESIVLPLITIQQHCLQRINQLNQQADVDLDLLAVYEKLVTRSLYGNINAARNAV